VVDHGYGLMSLYGHMSSVAVKVGDQVSKGQALGNSGSTGLAGGDHLHLEIFVQGKSVSPIEWLDEHWIRDNVTSKLTLPAAGAAEAEGAKPSEPAPTAARKPVAGRHHAERRRPRSR